MKRVLLVLFAFISLNAFSQELRVKEGSFKHVPGGIIEDKQEYTDGNDFPMALIKISTENINEQERMRLVFTGNRETQILKRPKTGQMWIYLSAEAATFIDIKHPDYGTYKYRFPERLCDYCVYEMVLQYVNNNASSNTYISVDSEPSGADIYIDGKHYGQTPNIITDLPMGKHEIKLEKQEYNSVTKIFIIEEGEKLKFNETLLSVYYKASAVEEEEKEIVNNSETDSDGNEVFNVKGVSFKMIKVEGGTFMMGATSEQGKDAFKDEKPAHSVTLSDYYIGETEVTQELWEAVMGSTPSSYSGYPQRPVERVSWNDCQEFITKLNQLTGKNFRLPTEAEWEYAARGGNKSKGYKYSGSNTIDDVAWYKDNSGNGTHNVKTKLANELGIYDMSGNVWEWCQDWYDRKYYQNSLQTNPTGPSSGSGRVIRGGSWHLNAKHCRVSNRSYYYPGYRNDYLCLRLALSQY